MLLIRSMSTSLPLFSSGRKCCPAPGSPSGTSSSGGGGSEPGRPRQGGLAVDVLLPQERLGADQAGGVLAEVLEAGLVDLHHDHRLAGIRRAVLVHPLAGQRHLDGRHRPTWRRRPAPARRGRGSRRCRRSPGPRTRPRRRSPPGRRRPAWPWPGARLWLRSSSWSGGHVGGVALRVGGLAAGQQVAVIRERVGAGDRLGRAARAAGEVVELEVVELLAGRDRRELPGGVGPAAAGAVRSWCRPARSSGRGSPARWRRARSGHWRRRRT